MKLLIDIPDRIYDTIQADEMISREQLAVLQIHILNGKPLPKGHWIHRTQDGGCFWEECSVCHTERAFTTKYCPDCGTYMYADIRTDAPTVIEADKEYGFEIVTRGNCIMCGKELDEGLFFCKECEAKI